MNAQILLFEYPYDGAEISPIKARELEFGFFAYASQAREFISRNHYSGICPPSEFYFRAAHSGETVGCCCFRRPSLPKTAKAYGADIELSRLAILDSAGKNSESRFIGYCLRWLRKNTAYRRVVSFADPFHGHIGTIYRASNFVFAGKEIGHGTRSICVDDEWMHSKTAYDRYGASGNNLALMLPGRRVSVRVNPQKYVYLYDLCESGE